MFASSFFSPKYKYYIHGFIFIWFIWLFLDSIESMNDMIQKHNYRENFKIYGSARLIIQILTFYVLSWWLIPLIIVNRKKGLYSVALYSLLYTVCSSWLYINETSIMFNSEEYNSTTVNYSFFNLKDLTRSFYGFVSFIFLSSVYSIAIIEKRLLTKKFTNKQLEVAINLIVLFFVFHLFILNTGAYQEKIKIFFEVGLFLLFFYMNTVLFGPILLKDKKIDIYLFRVILSYLSIIVITLLIYGINFLDLKHSDNLFTLTIFFIITTILSLTYTYIRLKIQNKELFFNLKLEAKESEINLLKSQVNPHFLFNTLNTLYATALEENAPKAAESTAKLANLIRYMQNDIKKDFIPLENEIKYLNDYITIQKLRCEVTPEIITHYKNIEEKVISPGLLIPFVENAFKYGLNPSKPSKLTISVIGDAKSINFECTNSYDTEYKTYYKEQGFGIGITNTKQRLQLIYPKKHTLVITKEKEIFKVKLSITTTT